MNAFKALRVFALIFIFAGFWIAFNGISCCQQNESSGLSSFDLACFSGFAVWVIFLSFAGLLLMAFALKKQQRTSKRDKPIVLDFYRP